MRRGSGRYSAYATRGSGAHRADGSKDTQTSSDEESEAEAEEEEEEERERSVPLFAW
jgi:ribosomal protein L12E/L44/L45/RPP1/RPP2